MRYGIAGFAFAIGSAVGLVLSGGQPAFAQSGCEPVTYLKAGDKVIGNSFTEITKVEKVTSPTQVFNLSVDGTRTFYVTDGTSVFLVHNK